MIIIKKLGLLLGLIGIILFITLTIVSMFLYPDGYSFFGDYFSTLGRTISYGGAPNLPARILFVIACVTAGITIIPFWIIFRKFFIETKRIKALSFLGSCCGIIASPFLALLAIFTTDTQYDPHIISSILFFAFFGVAVLIYSIAIILNNTYNNIFAYIGFALVVTIIIYITIFFNTPLNAAVQKFCVYGIIIWVFLNILNVWNKI